MSPRPDPPLLIASQGNINPPYVQYALFLAIALFAFPKGKLPGVPTISGLEFSLMSSIYVVTLASLAGTRFRVPQHPFLVYLMLFPFLVIASGVLPYVLGSDTVRGLVGFHGGHDVSPNPVDSILQGLRRVSSTLVILLLYNATLDHGGGRRLLLTIFYAIPSAGVLFILQVHGFMGPYEPPVPQSMPLAKILSDQLGVGFLHDIVKGIRFSGNTGSATSYGLLCALGLIWALHLRYHRHIGWSLFLLVSSVLVVFLILAMPKAVFVTFVLVYVVYLLVLRSAYVTAMLSFAVVLGLIYLPTSNMLLVMIQAIDVLTHDTEGSGGTRMEKWLSAGWITSGDPIQLLFGHGWRANPTGWHSEYVGLLMGFGPLFGLLLIGMITVGFWSWIHQLPLKTNAPISRALLYAFMVMILVPSFFQDLFHDSHVFFLLCMLVATAERLSRDESYAVVRPPAPSIP